ncbi:acyl- -binding domain-containing 1-like [Olea europaea subsp. europaea]|uniref:Acyl- -binding domain-containing 1-like n=1 Tax=Olea europaea subsp. europaea TaxID=158383 RepID=A0A8S0PCF7_OLEEU|nr:acyl- -binding domain-containing 1-like [Olea europaea subsp. europaea]
MCIIMAEWQQFVQSVFVGVIFSFLLAKLFSVIFAFRDENLRNARSVSPEPASKPAEETVASLSRGLGESKPLIVENEGLARESSTVGDLTDSDDDWEGVESTELDEAFSAATAFVAATAADSSAQNVSNEVQLQLYGFYKIATEGPCSVPQPSLLKPTARAKWQAWQKLGAMPPEEAMEKYIDIVTTLYPSWAMGSGTSRGEESSDAPNAGSKGPMGPVFSSFIYEEDSESELKFDAIHAFAREGDEEKLLKCIESGVPADLRDSEGRTPLHWAVDRGHMNITELLLKKNADVNAKDDEGQTPLHYAVVCERAAIAELLVKNNADTKIKDNDGDSPCELCESSWPWMQQISTSADD